MNKKRISPKNNVKKLRMLIAFSVFPLLCPATACALNWVTGINSGDTIVFCNSIDRKQIEIKLKGIFIPSRFNKSKCKISKNRLKNLDNASKQNLKKYIQLNSIIKINNFGWYDENLQLAGYIYRNSINLNFQMIKDGYACAYYWSTQLAEHDKILLKKILEKAKSQRKGLWAKNLMLMKCLCQPPIPEKRNL